MIETSIFNGLPSTLLHRINGEVSLEDVNGGIDILNEQINQVVRHHGRFNLIIDARDVVFKDLESHKYWKQSIATHPLIKDKIRHMAFVVHDSVHTRVEGELFDSERIRFFFDFDEGSRWLREISNSENDLIG